MSPPKRTLATKGHGRPVPAGFIYDKDGYLEWLVGNFIERTRENNLYCGEHRPGYRAHCHSELQPGASVVAKSEGTWKGTTSSPFLAGVVVPAIYC